MSRRLALAALCALLLAPAFAAEEDGSSAGASVRVIPSRPVEPGTVITIQGVAPLDAKGAVAVRIQPPNNTTQIKLDVNPSANGDYSVNFSGTTAPGSYGVGVASPLGKAIGKGRFEVVVMEDVDVLEIAVAKALEEAEATAKVMDDIERDLDAQTAKLPDNPAKEELKQRLAELKPQLQKARLTAADLKQTLDPIRAFADSDADLKPLLRVSANALDDWTKRSADERQRISNQLTASRAANITCESLERVIEGFKFAGALAKALAEPLSVILDPLKDLMTNLAFRAATPALNRLRLAPTKLNSLLEKLEKKQESFQTAVGKALGHVESKKKSQNDLLGKLSNAAAWLAGKVFDQYCERFSGPFDGNMKAQFFSKTNHDKWWEFGIQFKGQLDLRYAKDGGGVAGAATAVSGEFTGQAVHFSFWENAVRIAFPTITRGATMYHRSVIPQPWLFGAPMPDEPREVEIEGKAGAAMVKPYGFMVPVQGEIVDDVLTLRFQSATQDYTANARVVYVILSPLTFAPIVTGFELPFKDANFFFLRASKGDAVKLKVKRGAKSMSATETFTNTSGNSIAKADFTLKLNLCNPVGKC